MSAGTMTPMGVCQLSADPSATLPAVLLLNPEDILQSCLTLITVLW